MSNKYDFHVSIHGTIQGQIWMPAITCEKSFSYRVRPTTCKDETLRDAVLRITNDGDFQSSNLLLDSFVEVKMVKHTKTSDIVRSRIFEITSPLFTSIQDCIEQDYPNFQGE